MTSAKVVKSLSACALFGLALTCASTARAAFLHSATGWGASNRLEFWIDPDGRGLYSFDAMRWLEQDGARVFDIEVDRTQAIELCFYAADNRGAARAFDAIDVILGTAKATDDPNSGVDCFTLAPERLDEVLDVISGSRSIAWTTSYKPPTSLIEMAMEESPPDPSDDARMMNQVRVHDLVPRYEVAVIAPANSSKLYRRLDTGALESIEDQIVTVEIGSVGALEVCVEGEDPSRVAFENQGEAEVGACATVLVSCDEPDNAVTIWVGDLNGSRSPRSLVDPDPAPGTRTTTIRPIKSCPPPS